MKNRTATLIITALATGALGTAAAAQAGSQDETFRLAEVAGAALPVLVEEEDGCREEVLAGSLTLETDGDWILVMREREVCGDRVEEEEEREEGTYSIEGSTIRFLDDDPDDRDDQDDRDDRDEIDLDDMATGTLSSDGLTVRLEDGETIVVFRR